MPWEEVNIASTHSIVLTSSLFCTFLMTVALEYVLKSGSVIEFEFILINFRLSFSILANSIIWDFDSDCFESVDHLGQYWQLVVLII